MDRIRAAADQNREQFRRWFESLPNAVQYERILDALPICDLPKVLEDKRPLAMKLPELREYYYTCV